MQTTLALIAALASVAAAAPAVVEAPAACATDYAGSFDFTTYKAGSAKRDLSNKVSKRASAYTIKGGQFLDSQNRIGEIVANHQFQFDAQPQAGYIADGLWSVCSNGSIALGSSTFFYQCEKEPNVYDIYDNTLDPNSLAGCEGITIDVIPSGDATTTASASQGADGQPQASSATSAVSQKSDGQPQVPSATSVVSTASQLSDGQVQAPTAVTQLTDGQIQVATAAPAPTASQLTDGQPQVKSATAKVSTASQLTDGQPQVASATASASQLTDGQPQVASATAKPSTASQLTDGQPQVASATAAPNATTSTVPFTGAGNAIAIGSSFAAVFLAVVAALL